MEQKYELEEAKKILNDIKELHNAPDHKQEDVAKCYFVEKYADWLINELEVKNDRIAELLEIGEFFEQGYFQFLHALEEIKKSEVIGTEPVTRKKVVSNVGKMALQGLGEYDENKYVLFDIAKNV